MPDFTFFRGKQPFTILVCGDKRWEDSKVIETTLKYIQSHVRIARVIAQKQSGAATIAIKAAINLKLARKVYSRRVEKYGTKALDMQVKRMFKDGAPSIVLCFSSDVSFSPSAWAVVSGAIHRNISVLMVSR